MIKALKGLKEVYSKPYYILVALSGMLLFYLLDVIVSDFSDLRTIALSGYGKLTALKLTFNYFIGYPSTLDNFSVFTLFSISILFGSYLAMAIYKTGQLNGIEKTSIFGTAGLFLGLFAPGCFACGIGFASILGLSGFLLALPFEGVEIFVLSFLLLLYSNYNIASKVYSNVCYIKSK